MIPALPFPTENKALDLRESPEGLKVLFVSPSELASTEQTDSLQHRRRSDMGLWSYDH